MTRFRGLAAMLAIVSCQAGASSAHADQSFDSNGVKINFAIKGNGPPVILIHGWLSSGWINWDLPGTARLLAQEYQVIWLDMPGHGRSDRPARDEAYGPELVEHVIRLMDHLKIKKAHIVGYSMGGIIAAKLLARYPDRALSGTLGGMGWLREGSIEQKFFASGGKDGQPVGVCFRNLAKLALTEEEIKSVRAPVLVLFGDRDFLKRGYTEALQGVRRDWPVIDIGNADHLSCVFSQQFKEEIRKWLAKQEQRLAK
jgi:pimeloyl-ACP methyl ester carboxylesterase